jgi:uncharacterized protein YndB with AHSA1/START domain
MDINSNAPALARHQILINASLEKVWRLLSDINHWSAWQPDISSAVLDGTLTPGTMFRWKSGGSRVVSQLQDVEPQHRLGWTGKAMGARARHLWILEPQSDGVLVRTEESFEGWVVFLLKRRMQKTLDKSLQAWMVQLKKTAESIS